MLPHAPEQVAVGAEIWAVLPLQRESPVGGAPVKLWARPHLQIRHNRRDLSCRQICVTVKAQILRLHMLLRLAETDVMSERAIRARSRHPPRGTKGGEYRYQQDPDAGKRKSGRIENADAEQQRFD